VICTDENDRADFERLHSRCFEHEAIACAFDLLRLDVDDLRRKPLFGPQGGPAKAARRGGIQYVARAEMCGEEAFAEACDAGVEGIVSKRLTAPYKCGLCKSWIKLRNAKVSAYLRIADASF
jgi:bifunctional non-homologous end joining protein LigD